MPTYFGVTLDSSFPQDLFTEDFAKSALTQNPTIIPEIDYVWVLSGRSTILGNDADGLKREFDYADDLTRMSEGIKIATRVNLLRAGKKEVGQLTKEEWVTPIFYNGRKIHNRDLKEALAEEKISYPAHLFIIVDIEPENTIGQIRSFKDYFYSQSEGIKNIAVVSNAYHIPRVARTIGNESPQTEVKKIYAWKPQKVGKETRVTTIDEGTPIRQFNFFLFGVCKQEKRPGIVYDLGGEYRAMLNYSSGKQPSIARQQSNNTFFNDFDLYAFKSLRHMLFWHYAADIPIAKNFVFSLKKSNSQYQKHLNPQDIDSRSDKDHNLYFARS